MKRLRLDRWASQLQHAPRNPRLCLLHEHQQRCPFSHDPTPEPPRNVQQRQYHIDLRWRTHRRSATGVRKASGVAAAQVESGSEYVASLNASSTSSSPPARVPLNAPSYKRASSSAKLSALHARLSLPAKLPVQTLARCLIDPSVDARPGYNNAPLAQLGQDLLAYYTSEHLLCHYPRLPMPVLFAAQYAYVGPATLAAMRTEWGVEVAAAPGIEVDPGLLQLKRTVPGNAMAEDGRRRLKDTPQASRLGAGQRNDQSYYRRGMSSRIVFDDEFGDLLPAPEETAPYLGAPTSTSRSSTLGEAHSTADLPEDTYASEDGTGLVSETPPTTVEAASAGFVRALAGALYLHAGAVASKHFHQDHVLSRHLQLHTLFNFTHPTRDLSRLCAREGFEPPVARLISETGRLSRHPVFVVGVFSGNDKLGEAAGSSLNEGRVRAAAAALRSWYLYSPPDTEIVLPSDVEGGAAGKKAWRPQMVDMGEIVS